MLQRLWGIFSNMTVCVRCIVSGRVQGVFFRATAQRKALELKISGWARNLPDGRVEVLACGDEANVKELQDWLWQGPPHARVTDVSVGVLELQRINGFSVG
ncbi:MAG TPA: acylphosphatase [Gammaproteobacteria bacterium]